MLPIRLLLRLKHDTRGQVLLFGAVLVVAILAFMLAIPNGTQATTQKVRAQTAADIGAFSGSVWLARSLNLNANMNIGIKSVYTWATVLTMGSALAQALYSDTLDEGARQMGIDLISALFGTSDPPQVVTNTQYPNALQSLNTTALWLAQLQDDIAESFSQVAASLGTEEASRNAGAYPPSPSAGGWVMVRSNDTTDTTPLLVGSARGESLMYDDLQLIADRLESLPSGNDNIGDVVGTIIVDPDSFDIYAYYGFRSEWWTYKYFMHYTMFWIMHVFENKETHLVDSQYAYLPNPGQDPWKNFLQAATFPDQRLPQDSWAPWSPYRMGQQRDSFSYHLIRTWPGGNDKYKIDTVWWVDNRQPKWVDTASFLPGGDSVEIPDPSWIHDSTKIIHDFFKGADSTVTHTWSKVLPRRPNPSREYHSVAYVWRQQAATPPHGLSAPLGGTLFPRAQVAAWSPMLTVARSVPYMAVPHATEYDYYFTPGWDVKLTPFDSVGVLEIASNTALGGYGVHTRGAYNLEELRKYVLLP
jgi:hypothetical protein